MEKRTDYSVLFFYAGKQAYVYVQGLVPAVCIFDYCKNFCYNIIESKNRLFERSVSMFYYEIDFLEENTKEVKKDKGIIAGDKWDEVVKRLVDYYGNYDAKDDFGLISIEKLYPLEEVLDRHSMAGLFDLLVPYEKEEKKSSDKITDE